MMLRTDTSADQAAWRMTVSDPREQSAVVYTAYAMLLRGIAIRKFGVPHDDAETLVQDVFATYLHRIDAVRQPRSYLVGAICNASRQYWRRVDAERRLFAPAADDEAIDDDALRVVSAELAVAAVLAQLGARCRELLRRYYLVEETSADIAAEIGRSTDYVRHLLQSCRRRALRLLRVPRSRR